MKTLLSIFLLAAVLPQWANAQILTKAEQGRIAVAQCYSSCMDRLDRSGKYAFDYMQQFLLHVDSLDYRLLSEDDKESANSNAIENACELAVSSVRIANACYGECLDVEAVYGEQQSHAKDRFLFVYENDRDILRQAGLWKDYNNSPDSIEDPEEWVKACFNLLDIVYSDDDESDDESDE